MPTPTVFISYSHKDENWKNRLVTHLGVLEYEGLLQTWNDREIRAGEEWFKKIEEAMSTARVAVLLISANSLTSKFILHREIPRLFERRTNQGMTFFPVILKSCAWTQLPWLAKFQARPLDGRPLAAFRGNGRDAELTKIAEEILELASREPTTAVPEAFQEVTSSLRALHQLPPPPRDFKGRKEDLAFFKEKLAQGGAGAILGLQGMGGLGKTTLALKLAEELTPLYTDAQIYLDLKGVDPKPLTSTQAMAHVIRSFHPEVQIPEDQTQLAALYRSVLHGKRTILVMDNASREGREQVEPLIPPAGSLLLVTSRFHFHLPGLSARALDELPIENARELLLEIASRIGKDANRIARLCGCLPLALRLAGSALAERPHLSPTEYARRLKEGKERPKEVYAALDLSYRLLTEEHQRLWRTLAVFPTTFDTPAAAAVWGMKLEITHDVLGDLIRYSLIEWEQTQERYRLHDLARYFAGSLLKSTERKKASLRHASHFINILTHADHLFTNSKEKNLSGLRLFDIEWSNIQAGQAWAATQATSLRKAAQLSNRYPISGATILYLRLHPRESVLWQEKALEAAKRLKDRSSEGIHLGNLGIAYSELEEYELAIDAFERSLEIVREVSDKKTEGNNLNNLGVIYRDLGQIDRAVEFFKNRLGIARQIGDRHGEISGLVNSGLIYAILGQSDLSRELCEQGIALAREIGDRRGEVNGLNSLGRAYSALGNTARAIELHQQQFALSLEIGDRHGTTSALHNLGIEYEHLGEYRRAIEIYQQTLSLGRELGNQRDEAHSLGCLAFAYEALGEPRRAIEFYEQWLAIARETGDRRGEASALGSLGNAYIDLSEPRRAIEFYEQWLTIARETGDRRGEASALGSLGNAYIDLSEPRRAIEFYEQWLATARETGDRREEANTSWNLGLCYEAEGSLRHAADLMQVCVDFEREIGHPDAEEDAAYVEAIRVRAEIKDSEKLSSGGNI